LIADKARFKYAKKLEKAAGFRIPDFAFHGAFLEAASGAVNYERLDPNLRNQLLNFFRTFLSCKCRQAPLCGCPERKFAVEIIELRQMGLDHRQISEHLIEEYAIELYPADILSFLEESVHVLEAIRDVAALEGEEEMAKKAKAHIRDIER
jgi:superfamily II helicase